MRTGRLLGLLAILPLQAAIPPVESIREMVVDPRLEVQVWASEPDVVDPVAISWDEWGAAYVAECRDYPYGAGPDGRVGSAIRRLVDLNGDGRVDRATVFADGLSYVTSVSPHRGGVLVVAPPDVLWLQDRDGDGVADHREVILTGLHRGISDSLANGLRYGLDNHFHVANGGSGGEIRSPRIPNAVTPLGHHDFAFQADTGRVELTGVTGGGFGLVFDPFGRVFTPYNISHIQHRFLALEVTRRHPGFPPVALTDSISDHEAMSRIYPISTALTRPNHPEQAGHFSAAGGMGYLDSGAFPKDLQGSVLVGDAVGNLIHRDVIHPDGPVFQARRASEEQSHEFLASRDPAFRPVAFEIGPDGALYVLDMQRDVIEHPDYIPEKIRKTLDIRAGENRGRIYRIIPKTGLTPHRLNRNPPSDADCIAWLSLSNAWRRNTAQRLLVERQATNSAPKLRDLALRASLPETRVQALWTLEGLGRLGDREILNAFQDSSPGVRENALLLASHHLTHSGSLSKALLQTLREPDASVRVRFIAAQTLGLLGGPEAADALVQILWLDRNHPWSRLAVMASIPSDQTHRVVEAILNFIQPPQGNQSPSTNTLEKDSRPVVDLIRDLAGLVGARGEGHSAEISWLIDRGAMLSNPEVRTALWDGLAEGITRSGARVDTAPSARRSLEERCSGAQSLEMDSLWRLTKTLGLPENASQRNALTRAIETVGNPNLPTEARRLALPLLALGSAEAVTNALVHLLDAREPIDLQKGALESLGAFKESALAPILLSRWRIMSPTLRPEVLQRMLDRKSYHEALLTALEGGQIRIGELNLDLEQRRRLLRGGTADIRRRAAVFMGDEEYSNRKSIVTDWMARLPKNGDAQKGRAVFEGTCAPCHAVGSLGHRVGPDLTGVAHRSVEDLLSNILDPNMAINPGFVAMEIETRDGETQQGLLASETPEALTLLQAGGQRRIISRREVVRMQSSGQSLMPEGLETGKTPEQLRDLIAFLQASP